MTSCSRCSVEYLICRRGKHGRDQVIEIVQSKDSLTPNGWTNYEIWVPLELRKSQVTPGDTRILEVDGLGYQWAMTIFSEQHSRDEDCNHPNRHKPNCGFPNRRYQLMADGQLERLTP
jgi:hypothetical protein